MSIPIASAVLGDVLELDDAGLPSTVQPLIPAVRSADCSIGPALIGGFAAGFLGAGVLGVLFGHGMVGEIERRCRRSRASVPAHAAHYAGPADLVVVARRQAAAFADLSPRQLADAYGRTRNEMLPDIEPGGDSDPAGAANDPFSTNDRPRHVAAAAITGRHHLRRTACRGRLAGPARRFGEPVRHVAFGAGAEREAEACTTKNECERPPDVTARNARIGLPVA